MILDELVLYNFGVYGGRQAIELTPAAPDKPIVLFGGLNGAGKTTLLDALQLSLYGSAARCSNRNGMAYEEFLRRSIHRGAEFPESSVEIAFRHTVGGEEQAYRLMRSWAATDTTCRERFQVIRNGDIDRLATEHWAEAVEEFLPNRIAHLFLFDGEKIEGYADLDNASALIETAIHNLLGLDIIERLASDLVVLERRKRSDLRPPEERREVDELRERLARLHDERQRVVQERAAAANLLDRRRHALSEADERFRREGGNLFERRAEIERGLGAVEAQVERVERDLREAAAGAAPLLMVGDLLASASDRDAAEHRARMSRATADALREEFAGVMASSRATALSAAARKALQSEIDERLAARDQAAAAPIELDLDGDARTVLAGLIQSDLEAAQDRLEELLVEERGARSRLEELRAEVAAIPSADALAHLIAARDAARLEVAALEGERRRQDGEVERLEREIETLQQRERRLLEKDSRERLEQEDVQRVLVHSAKVRDTLKTFRRAVVARNVSRIETLVQASFRDLIRKDSLVTDLRIDPQTFSMELRGADGKVLSPERLSAGERQMLAVATLWGLAKASGRPLPAVIDTPLGRLDSAHRSHLIQRYFPKASHQVLLLSTDEEIYGRYYDELEPAIGRSYRLEFDEVERRTRIEPGYFATGEAAAHAH